MKTTLFAIFTFAIITLLVVSQLSSDDRIKRQILQAFPQADLDGDGLLSDREFKAVCDRALKNYPQADLDGDGVLSVREQAALLRKVRLAKIGLDGTPQSKDEDPATSLSATQPEIRQGPRQVKAGEFGVGLQIPELSFTDINGQTHQLGDFAKSKAVVFAMTGTGCPLCLKYASSLAKIENQYSEKEVAFVYINPNESEKGDKIQAAIQKHGFIGPYVRDSEMVLPGILGAKTTTEVFVLDRARTLVYRGAVDDQYGFAYSLDAPRTNYLTNALDSVLSGRVPKIAATSSPGCDLFYDNQAVQKPEVNITYHNRVSRIIQTNCLECHREDGIAPMGLATYEEVTDYAGMIRSVVDRGVMPPWFAAPLPSEKDNSISHWSNDRSLSDADKADLFAWIDAGAPEGDPKDAPLKKTFPAGWLIGKPDAVFEFPKPVPVKATGIMPYKHITVETNLPEDKWVQAIEVRPGKLEVVHHVIVSIKAGEGEFDESDGYWGAYVPGNSTLIYPEGYARLLPKGSKLRFQMHYTPNGTATEDSTRIGVIYADKPPRHEVRVAGIANRRIRIPAGADNHREEATLRLPFGVQILSFLPHMHLRGKAARYESITDGRMNVLLDIPRYDFNWQLQYKLAEPLALQRGDSIRFTGWFDNSKNNPANPDPTKVVKWGQQTEDEMHLGYVEYIVTGAKPGDGSSGIRRRRRGSNRPEKRNETVDSASVLRAFRQLDHNQDGKVKRQRVPAKHHRIFDLLDGKRDGVLTKEEASSARHSR